MKRFMQFRGEKVDVSGVIIITEFKNGSLELIVKKYLKNEGKGTEKLNPTIRSKIIFGVAAIMKRIHRHNLIHKLLNLENIYLDDNLEPRIAYFGFNRMMIFDTVNLMMSNKTPFNLAPEVIEVDFTYDTSIDVYAFAFLIYKMFSNKAEFDTEKPIKTKFQFLNKISRGLRPKRPESISDAYWELINNCWKHYQGDRMTFDEITDELKKDIYAIEEFDMKTDLDQLHEYQKRIDKDE